MIFIYISGNMLVIDGIIREFSHKQYNCETINLNNRVVMPALKNAHIHLGESIFSPLKGTWSLNSYLMYTETINKFLGERKDSYWNYSATKTINECIKYGISNICTARGEHIFNQTSLKANVGFPIMNSNKLKSYLTKGLDGFVTFTKSSPKNVTPGLFVHSIYANTVKSLKLAQECNAFSKFLTIHVAETIESENAIKKLWNGHSSIFVLNDLGLLNSKTILVHGCYLNEVELELIAKTHSSLVICPISNLKLKTKCLNPSVLAKNNITWSLGSDGLATGENCNLFYHTKKLKKLFNTPSKEALKSITFYASDVLKYTKNKYLEEGYEADFIILNTKYNLNINKLIDNITNNHYKVLSLYINANKEHRLPISKTKVKFNYMSEKKWATKQVRILDKL